MKKALLSFSTIFLAIAGGYSATVQADSSVKNFSGKSDVIQATACLKGSLSRTGSPSWYSVFLSITNNCTTDQDLREATIVFKSTAVVNVSDFWKAGQDTSGLSALASPRIISSKPSGNLFDATLQLHFDQGSWVKSILPKGKTFIVQWGTNSYTYDGDSIQVTPGGETPQDGGTIDLTNSSAKPSNVVATTAPVDLVRGTVKVTTAQVPWKGTFAATNLSPGTYNIQPVTVFDSQGNSYQGIATPASVNVTENAKINSTISYSQIISQGSINVKTPALPSPLAGYTQSPTVVLTRVDTGAGVSQILPWNATTPISKLQASATYSFSTPIITFNGNKCVGTFSPASAASRTTSPLTTTLSYTCTSVSQDKINIKVSGLPTTTNSVTVNFQPSDGSTPSSKAVTISNGQGTDSINLTDGVIYSVSSTSQPQYTALYNPQPLTAAPNITESITYQKQAGGKVMAYMPGWKTPPSAASVAAAGYTHILVAFGVFSTDVNKAGQIIPIFDTISKEYISSLKQLGVKVILSLGGALTSTPNTTVDFHEAITKASSPAAFQTAFIQSVQSLMTQYGFDGIDIDIEHGLNGSGSFAAPTGDIAVMANIINTLHKNNPNLIISLVPQTANVAPTSGFDGVWGNYASLVMQTRDALSWVGVQVYNTGCVFGLDLKCYADTATSPDLSVAIAAGLLENWPSKTSSGQSTGFQPYISYLNPSQVVLGYPAPNSAGQADGGTIKSTAVIKRAIQCLRTGVIGSTSCGSYVPPRLYPNIGGVFEWEITYDQSNNFKFATELKACVLNGSC